MSPATAQALAKGDHVAKRGKPDLKNFTHIGEVVRRTKLAIYIAFAGEPAAGLCVRFNNVEMLRTLRTADVAEAAAYNRTID